MVLTRAVTIIFLFFRLRVRLANPAALTPQGLADIHRTNIARDSGGDTDGMLAVVQAV